MHTGCTTPCRTAVMHSMSKKCLLQSASARLPWLHKEWHRCSAPDVQHRLLQPARDVQLVPVAQVRAQRLGRHHAVFEQLQRISTV